MARCRSTEIFYLMQLWFFFSEYVPLFKILIKMYYNFNAKFK